MKLNSAVNFPSNAPQTCIECTSKCCTNRETVVLFPSEVASFNKKVPDAENAIMEFTNKNGTTINTLKQTTKRKCYFLQEDGKCGIYENRPLECKIYPVIMEFSDEATKKKKNFFVKKEYCPLSDKIKVNEKELQKEIEKIKQNLSTDWISEYQKIP